MQFLDDDVVPNFDQLDALQALKHAAKVKSMLDVRGLAHSGAHPNVIKDVMLPSTIVLTTDRYGHLFAGQTSEAVQSMPTMFEERTLRKTGTAFIAPVTNQGGYQSGTHTVNDYESDWPLTTQEEGLNTPDRIRTCDLRFRRPHIECESPSILCQNENGGYQSGTHMVNHPDPVRTKDNCEDVAFVDKVDAQLVNHIKNRPPYFTELDHLCQVWPSLSDSSRRDILTTAGNAIRQHKLKNARDMLDRVQDELAQCQLENDLRRSVELLTQVRYEINKVASNHEAAVP